MRMLPVSCLPGVNRTVLRILFPGSYMCFAAGRSSGHVIKTVESLGIRRICAVAGSPEVGRYLGPRAMVCYQEKERGSADALLAARPQLEQLCGDFLVVYGDRPFIKASTLESLAIQARQHQAAADPQRRRC